MIKSLLSEEMKLYKTSFIIFWYISSLFSPDIFDMLNTFMRKVPWENEFSSRLLNEGVG